MGKDAQNQTGDQPAVRHPPGVNEALSKTTRIAHLVGSRSLLNCIVREKGTEGKAGPPLQMLKGTRQKPKSEGSRK